MSTRESINGSVSWKTISTVAAWVLGVIVVPSMFHVISSAITKIDTIDTKVNNLMVRVEGIDVRVDGIDKSLEEVKQYQRNGSK